MAGHPDALPIDAAGAVLVPQAGDALFERADRIEQKDDVGQAVERVDVASERLEVPPQGRQIFAASPAQLDRIRVGRQHDDIAMARPVGRQFSERLTRSAGAMREDDQRKPAGSARCGDGIADGDLEVLPLLVAQHEVLRRRRPPRP